MEQWPSREKILRQLELDYAGRDLLPGESAVEHGRHTAEIVERIATAHYQDVAGTGLAHDQNEFLLPSQLEIIESLNLAAILHEYIERTGADFEQVLALSNMRTATYAAAVTRDCRLPAERRQREYRGLLTYASVEVHILVLADIIATAQAAKRYLKARKTEPAALEVFQLTDSLRLDLAALPAPGYHLILKRYMDVLDEKLRLLHADAEQRFLTLNRRAKILKSIRSRGD